MNSTAKRFAAETILPTMGSGLSNARPHVHGYLPSFEVVVNRDDLGLLSTFTGQSLADTIIVAESQHQLESPIAEPTTGLLGAASAALRGMVAG